MDHKFVIFQISVYPQEAKQENPNSYRARKREYFRMRRERRKARLEGLEPFLGGLVAEPEPQLALASASDDADATANC